MTTDLAVRPQQNHLAVGPMRLNGLDDLARVAQMVARTGWIKDGKQPASPESVGLRMMYAMTMGFEPIAGLNGVDLIDGNPSPNAHFWAAAMEDHPGYDYAVEANTDAECTVAFYRVTPGGERELRGKVTWTMEDAKRAGLATKDNWKKYPRAMLFHRALTEGGRMYCPGLFGGVRAYVPEELGSDAPPAPPAMGVPTEVIDAAGEVIEVPESPAGAVAPAGGAGEREDAGEPPPAADDSEDVLAKARTMGDQAPAEGQQQMVPDPPPASIDPDDPEATS